MYFKGILLVLAGVLTGCDSSEDPENTTLELVSISFVNEAIANASEHNYEKEHLPIWLTEFIHNLKPDSVRNVAAFQTKWKKEVVYYVHDDYSRVSFVPLSSQMARNLMGQKMTLMNSGNRHMIGKLFI